MIEREWAAAQEYLRHAFMFTVFGYSAPVTDVEAKRETLPPKKHGNIPL
jgi:hypothetical protein